MMLRRVLLIAGTARKKTSCLRGDGWKERDWSWRERRRWSWVVRGWGPREKRLLPGPRWRERVANDVGPASTPSRPGAGVVRAARRTV